MTEDVVKENFVLKDDEVLEVRSDRVFHDLFNEHEMDTIEWTVMQILNCSKEDVHGKVKVGNIRLVPQSKDDKQKYVDLIVYYNNTINVIELNNECRGNYLRNVLYVMNVLNNSYINGEDYINKKVRGILVNLNWYATKELKDRKEREEIIYGYPIIGYEKSDYILKIININLDYFKNKRYNGPRDVDVLWKLLTRNSKDEVRKIASDEDMLTGYYQKLNRLSHNKEYCRMVWDERIEKNLRAQEAYYGGKQDGLAEGKELGIAEGKELGLAEGKELGIAKGKELGLAEGKELGIAEGKELGLAEGKELGIAEGKELGIAEGKELGLAEGKDFTKKEMIQNMYKNGLSLEIISKGTSLSIDEISNIIKLDSE